MWSELDQLLLQGLQPRWISGSAHGPHPRDPALRAPPDPANANIPGGLATVSVLAAEADGHLDWISQTAGQALEELVTRTGLEIARLLLQDAEEPWEKARVAEDSQRARDAAGTELLSTDLSLSSSAGLGRERGLAVEGGYGQ